MPEDKIGLFRERDARRLMRLLRREMQRPQHRNPQGTGPLMPRNISNPVLPAFHLIQAPVGGIPPRTGSNPGSAVCNILSFDGLQLTVTTDTITVWNLTGQTVADYGDRYAMATYHLPSQTWWIEVEDCEPQQEGPFNP